MDVFAAQAALEDYRVAEARFFADAVLLVLMLAV